MFINLNEIKHEIVNYFMKNTAKMTNNLKSEKIFLNAKIKQSKEGKKVKKYPEL